MSRPVRLRKIDTSTWEVGCNLCWHATEHHDHAEALHRASEIALRARVLALPWVDVLADRDDLARQVDMLAEERDELAATIADLTDKLARAEQARADQRMHMRAAYEPVDVGDCRKVRHIGRDTAERHAVSIAAAARATSSTSTNAASARPTGGWGPAPSTSGTPGSRTPDTSTSSAGSCTTGAAASSRHPPATRCGRAPPTAKPPPHDHHPTRLCRTPRGDPMTPPVETHVQPPEQDHDEDGDSTSGRLSVHWIGPEDTSYDAAVQMFDTAATDPAEFADAVLRASLALAALVGPDHSWAVMQRLSAYDGMPR